MANIQLTRDQLDELKRTVDTNPTSAKLRELVVEYATNHGGEALKFWRLFRGDYFDEPTIMSSEHIAKRLKRPVSELERIYIETMLWVKPRWQSSPEYQANPPHHPTSDPDTNRVVRRQHA